MDGHREFHTQTLGGMEYLQAGSVMNPQVNPYVGPRTFLREESYLFFGRERESSDLIALVASEQSVLFYAQSGAGKSSLINTRLIPSLESKGYEVLPVGRVSGDLPAGLDVDDVFIYNLLHSLVQQEINLEALTKLTLTDFLAKLNHDELGYFYDDTPLPEVPPEGEFMAPRRALIIDQFEELISTHPEAWKKHEDFFSQLAQAMQDDPYLWVILVMREEFIAALDPYAHLLPRGLRARYYMQRLNRDAALKAIKGPVQELRPYAPGVAEKLVDDLCRVKVQNPDGTLEEQPGQYVEPVQLQVVCYSLWENLPSEGTQITEADLQEIGDVDHSLARYYEERVKSVAIAKNVRERLIREWFEKKLITPEGIRNLVLQEPHHKNGGLDDDVIQALQSDLVRAEKRAGITWYELTHDRLVGPILENNRNWFDKNLGPLQRQAALWHDQGQNESWLLGGRALAEIEKWRKLHQDELTATEEEFLRASRSVVEREQRAKRRTRLITILGIIAIILAVVAYTANLNAQRQARIAFTRQLAAQSHEALEDRPILSILLAMEANLGMNPGEQSVTAAEEALRATLQTPHGLPLLGPNGPVKILAFSPDGHWLASGGDDRTISLWDMKTNDKNTRALTLTGHKDKINALVFSDDGHWLATASEDETVRLWDLTTAEPSNHSRILPASEIYALAFSPDGHWLATGSQEENVSLWNLTSPEATDAAIVLDTPGTWINSVAFSLEGNWLAAGGSGGTASLWNLTANGPVGNPIPLSGHGGPILTLAFSPDGRWLATGCTDKKARLWNLTSPKPGKDPRILPNSDSVTALAFSPGEHWLATGSADGTARLWDLTKGDRNANPIFLPGHTGSINTLAFSPNARWLATGSGDNSVRMWDIESPVPAVNPTVLSGHDGPVNALVFSPDGHWLATGGQDGGVRLWDQVNPDPAVSPIVLKGHEDDITSLAFSPDGHWLATASSDKNARLWDLKTVDPAIGSKLLRGHTVSVEVLAFSPDGHWLATGSGDHTTLLWDLRTADPTAQPFKLDGYTNWIQTLAFSPDGHWLAIGSDDAKTELWDLSSGKPGSNPLVLQKDNGDINILTFSPDGHWLATGSSDNIVRLWDMSVPGQGMNPYELRGHKDNIFALAFSPDERWLATGSGGGDPRVLLWSLTATGPSSEPKPLGKHKNRVSALAFSPNGRWLASGSWDSTTRLWNLNDPDPAAVPKVLLGHTDWVNSLAFSADGHWLATGGADGTALLWNLNSPAPTGEPIRLADVQDAIRTLAFSPEGRWLATGGADNTVHLWLVELNELERLACGITGRNLSKTEWEQYLPGKTYHKTCQQWP